MRGLLVNGYRQGSVVCLWVRGEDNKKHLLKINDFSPYFYISARYGECKGLYGESITKKFVDDPSDVPNERLKYTCSFEADIPYVLRFLIDKDITKGLEFPDGKTTLSQNEISPCQVTIEPLIMYFDIELLPSDKGFPDVKDAKHPVVAFTFKTNKDPKYFTYIYSSQIKEEKIIKKNENWIVIYVTSEKDLLIKFAQVIDLIKPDILSGYNILNFDLPYLKNRFYRLGLNWVNDKIFDTFDIYIGYKHIYSQPSYQLKRVAVIEGIEQEYRGSFSDIAESYHNNLDKFIKYNRDDVYDAVELDKKHSLIPFFLQLKYSSGISSLEAMLSQSHEKKPKGISYSKLLDTKLLHIAKQKGICLPTKAPLNGNEMQTFTGAYVYVASKGLYKDVAVFDYNRFYPSIILSFCLSPENVVSIKDDADITINNDEPSKHLYLKNNEGIVQALIKAMFAERDLVEKELKKLKPGTLEYKSLSLRKQAVKDLTNAIYGQLGYVKSRVFNLELAKAVTQLGREGTKFVIKIAEEYGYIVLISDTDSISIQLPFEKAEDFSNKLNIEIKKYFEEKYNINVDISLKFEKYYKNLLLTGVKKRYAYRCSFEGKECDYISSRGFENIRTDQSDFTRTLLTELFELVLYEKPKKEIKDFINKKLEDFSKRPLSEIAISRGINKRLDSYKSKGPHVRGAIYSNTYLGTNFRYGDKVKVLWVKGIVGFKQPTNVICFDDETKLPEKIIVDWEHMKRVCIIDKVKSILEAVGINLESTTIQGSLY